MSETNRRLTERYALRAPALLHPSGDSGCPPCHFALTRDISSHGAYFLIREAQSCPGHVQVELLLQVPAPESPAKYAYMATTGEVVRRDEVGVAVRFDEDYTLSPFI
jgi:hypothetical protein